MKITAMKEMVDAALYGKELQRLLIKKYMLFSTRIKCASIPYFRNYSTFFLGTVSNVFLLSCPAIERAV